MTAPDLGLALSPFHLLQLLCVEAPAGLRILTKQHEQCSKLFEGLGPYEFRPGREAEKELARIRREQPRITFYHAAPWRRKALQLERATLEAGGRVGLIEDGVANYIPRRLRFSFRELVRGVRYRLKDGTRYCRHVSQYRGKPGFTTAYSLVPEQSVVPGSQQLDPARLRAALPKLAPAYEHLRPYRGLPVFMDTNDCDWYPAERKVAILREVLPAVPMVYFPHPRQKTRLTRFFPNWIDLDGQTHGFNELACHFLEPKTVYSAFSTAPITLRHLLGLQFENVFLYRTFHAGTGFHAFDLEVDLERVVDGVGS